MIRRLRAKINWWIFMARYILSAKLFVLAMDICPCRTVVHILDDVPDPDVNMFGDPPGGLDE